MFVTLVADITDTMDRYVNSSVTSWSVDGTSFCFCVRPDTRQ